MKITIKFFANLRERYGKDVKITINRDNVTIKDILSEVKGLLNEISENDEIKNIYKVLLNGHNIIYIKGLDTEVKDGDEIFIFPPVAGG